MFSFKYNKNLLIKQVCFVFFLIGIYVQVIGAKVSGDRGLRPIEVVNGNLDTIFLNYVNSISLPKGFSNTVLSLYHVETKKANVRAVRNKNSLVIDEILDEGYYFLELKNKQQITVYQQLLFAKKMADPRVLLNQDTVMATYRKADLLKKFQLGLRFEEKEAAPLCSLVRYDLIVLPYKRDPEQTRLRAVTQFHSDQKTKLLHQLNSEARVFISDVIVQFANEKEPRNIGSFSFTISETN